MNIVASIKIKVDSIEEFEAKYPKHEILTVSGKPFLFWCRMCPEPIVLDDIWTFVDEDNNKVEHTTDRRVHLKHFLPNL
jgi:hypothetical protein